MSAARSIAHLSPLRLFDQLEGGPLRSGELVLLVAPAGVGKSSCLVQIALRYLLERQPVVHIVLGQPLPRVLTWYDRGLKELAEGAAVEISQIPNLDQLTTLRHITSYPAKGCTVEMICDGLRQICQGRTIPPKVVIIDGFPVAHASHERVEVLRDLAAELGVVMWISALGKGKGLRKESTAGPFGQIAPLFDVLARIRPGDAFSKLQIIQSRETALSKPITMKLNPRTLLRASEEP